MLVCFLHFRVKYQYPNGLKDLCMMMQGNRSLTVVDPDHAAEVYSSVTHVVVPRTHLHVF